MAKISSSNFKKLIGTWKTSGKIMTDKEPFALSGTDTYEFILLENFILHTADVNMGNEQSQTFELIRLEKSAEKAKMHYFNSKGESGVMTGHIKDHDFLIEGDGLKFIGTITADNSTIHGTWFQQAGAENWKEFIILKLEKQ